MTEERGRNDKSNGVVITDDCGSLLGLVNEIASSLRSKVYNLKVTSARRLQ